jgi:hypothetical protein
MRTEREQRREEEACRAEEEGGRRRHGERWEAELHLSPLTSKQVQFLTTDGRRAEGKGARTSDAAGQTGQ